MFLLLAVDVCLLLKCIKRYEEHKENSKKLNIDDIYFFLVH